MGFRRILLSSFFLFLTGAVLAQTPTGLTVTAATNKRVDLSWTGTATGYNVQRRTLGGTYSNIASVTTTTASDTTIDAFTTYQYQIVATSGSTTASNQVTVGPPPAGYSVAVPSPGAPGSDTASNFGQDLTLVLDGNGDPAMAYIFQDPNLDSDYSDSELRFRSWSRARYTWNAEARVGLVGDAVSRFRPTVSLGYDASTNTFAVATEVNLGDTIRLYTSSNGGSTWTLKTTFADNESTFRGPSLAMANGNLFLSFQKSGVGVQYVTGPLSGNPTTWTTKTAPKATGTEIADTSATTLALDSAGVPGVAYFVADSNVDYNRVLLFWRPAGAASPVRALDSQGRQSDEVAVKLAYSGLQPRVAVYVQRNDADFGVGLHFARSQDGGATWQTPVVIPPDGDSSSDYPFDMAFDSQGHGAIAFGQNSGSGDQKCGNPKLSLSTDLITWKACASGDLTTTGSFAPYPSSIGVLYGANDKLYMVWEEHYQNPTGVGLILYREPPAGSSNAPSLDVGTAVNGATFQAGMVPGSWAQVKGANLADVTRIWGDADFQGLGSNLPFSLSGTSVKVNNLPAAVYFISPTQVSFQVPGGVIAGAANVQVIRNGIPSNTITGQSTPNAPGLFGYTVNGKTYPAALFANSFLVVGDPAVAGNIVRKAVSGDRIQLYATGLSSSPAGVLITSVAGLTGVTATIGTTPATVEFAGLVAVGEYQINILVPTLPDGEYPVVIRFNGQSSQTGVIIPVGR